MLGGDVFTEESGILDAVGAEMDEASGRVKGGREITRCAGDAANAPPALPRYILASISFSVPRRSPRAISRSLLYQEPNLLHL